MIFHIKIQLIVANPGIIDCVLNGIALLFIVEFDEKVTLVLTQCRNNVLSSDLPVKNDRILVKNDRFLMKNDENSGLQADGAEVPPRKGIRILH